ncbi:MAG: cell division protein FtsB [Woeseia sp.]|nr:septum formation initiator family protein [Woeseia sp.]MBT8097341.1 septum formation initiator family protein [Woeseia sp.]NNE60695.1 cell division protein FtsB [Woeseia sp.]NNL55048.1 cell division protein FtsB [Woeseia sp.]
MRLLLFTLIITAVALQTQLWLSDDGYRKTHQLRVAVGEQRTQNQDLANRNAALDAEVINLKKGRAAAEERARSDLGMIGHNETFFQVVPAQSVRRQ